MLLKNKAPSLKPQSNSEPTSSKEPISLPNKIKTNSLNISIKEEVKDEFPCPYVNDVIITKVKNEKDRDGGSKYCLTDLNTINTSDLKTGLDVVNASLSNLNDISQCDKNISIIDINIDDLFPSKGKTKKHITHRKDTKSNNKTNEIQLKSNDGGGKGGKSEVNNLKNEIRKHIKKSKENDLKSISGSIKAPQSLDTGVYVECDSCHKTRYLKDVYDPSEISSFWTCEMAKNNKFNCDMPQEPIDESLDTFIYNSYTLGSVVWAKAPGFCWWPGIIDDDPDLHMFYWCYENSNDVSHYHVTFLDDEVSRSWVTNKDIKVFRGKSDMNTMKFSKSKKDYTKTVMKAVERAEECLKLSLQECLDKYSFAIRYTGKDNLWTKQKLSSKRKSSSKKSLPDSDSEDLDDETIPKRPLFDNTKVKQSEHKSDKKPVDLKMQVSLLEAQTEVLIALNQQTKHDLIVKNTSKENKNKTKSKSRKKSQKSEIFEE